MTTSFTSTILIAINDDSDLIGEVVIQHEEDDDVVLDKLVRIHDAIDDQELSASLGWTVADWTVEENRHQEVC